MSSMISGGLSYRPHAEHEGRLCQMTICRRDLACACLWILLASCPEVRFLVKRLEGEAPWHIAAPETESSMTPQGLDGSLTS